MHVCVFALVCCDGVCVRVGTHESILMRILKSRDRETYVLECHITSRFDTAQRLPPPAHGSIQKRPR